MKLRASPRRLPVPSGFRLLELLAARARILDRFAALGRDVRPAGRGFVCDTNRDSNAPAAVDVLVQ